jgi:hypothetical protein
MTPGIVNYTEDSGIHGCFLMINQNDFIQVKTVLLGCSEKRNNVISESETL